MWLWECNYGYAKDYATFSALYPLKDAPYTAVYEEIEAVAAFHDYLSYLDGSAPEWAKILIPEFIRALMFKGSFYYPPALPDEMISQEPRTGKIEKNSGSPSKIFTMDTSRQVRWARKSMVPGSRSGWWLVITIA